jgi:hypothetical protein
MLFVTHSIQLNAIAASPFAESVTSGDEVFVIARAIALNSATLRLVESAATEDPIDALFAEADKCLPDLDRWLLERDIALDERDVRQPLKQSLLVPRCAVVSISKTLPAGNPGQLAN